MVYSFIKKRKLFLLDSIIDKSQVENYSIHRFHKLLQNF